MALPAWYGERGAEDDVVLLTRTLLARNLADFAFPHLLAPEERTAARDSVLRSVLAVLGPESSVEIAQDPPTARGGLVAEQTRIGQESPPAGAATVVGADGRVFVVVGAEDHLQLAALGPGLAVEETYAAVAEIDRGLDAKLHYAVSLEWGYLTSRVADAGTGLQASVLLHLPGIGMGTDTAEVGRTVERAGFRLAPLYPSRREGRAPADLYLLAQVQSAGTTEREILDKLADITGNLVHYEREVRGALLARKREELQESIRKAARLLSGAKALPLEETLELVSLVRWGVASAALPGGDLGAVTSLFFRTLPYHVLFESEVMENVDNADIVNRERARQVRAFFQSLAREGDADV